jgi:hypothetical protein
MVDSVNVIFHSPSRCEISPMIYLHWGRTSLLQDLTHALPRLRTGDVDYASARFIGCCHEKLEGAKNIGCKNLFLPPPSPDEGENVIYQRIMSEIPEDIAKVNVDQWVLEIDGNAIQLPAEKAARADGF